MYLSQNFPRGILCGDEAYVFEPRNGCEAALNHVAYLWLGLVQYLNRSVPNRGLRKI